MSVRTRIAALALIVPAALAAAGCSFSVGGPSVSAEDVEQQISQVVVNQTGTTPDDVSCPSSLKGEVGAELTCTVTVGDSSIDVKVTVTSVEGKKVNFSISEG